MRMGQAGSGRLRLIGVFGKRIRPYAEMNSRKGAKGAKNGRKEHIKTLGQSRAGNRGHIDPRIG